MGSEAKYQKKPFTLLTVNQNPSSSRKFAKQVSHLYGGWRRKKKKKNVETLVCGRSFCKASQINISLLETSVLT